MVFFPLFRFFFLLLFKAETLSPLHAPPHSLTIIFSALRQILSQQCVKPSVVFIQVPTFAAAFSGKMRFTHTVGKHAVMWDSRATVLDYPREKRLAAHLLLG